MKTLRQYIETEIIPRYDSFDAAHRRDHVEYVIAQSLKLAEHYDVDRDMVYAIAAYHDTGLAVDRKTHHLESGRIIRSDRSLRQWFNEARIEMMAQAVEDHRASSDHEPRSIYGKIVAEADRQIDPETIIRRTVQYDFCSFITADDLAFECSLCRSFDLAGIVVGYDLVIPRICIACDTADKSYAGYSDAACVIAVAHVRNHAAESADLVFIRTLCTRHRTG